MKRGIVIIITSLIMTASTAVVADSSEETKHVKYINQLKIDSLPATGFNRLYGKSVMKLGKFNDLGFETIGAYNPDGSEPEMLTRYTPSNTLVASYVDHEFLHNFMGGISESSLNQSYINVPLRDVAVNFLPTGNDYFRAPPVTEVNPEILFQGAQSLPVYQITLNEWMKAKGDMSFKCNIDGTSIVKMKLKGLIPLRIYTIWAFFESDDKELPFSDFGPIRPLGGVSNSVVADQDGKGKYERILNFCPMNLKDNQVPLSGVFVYFHSDQATYGAVMSHPGEGRFPGASGHVQLQFPVSDMINNNYVYKLHNNTVNSITQDTTPFTEDVFINDPFFKDENAPSRVVQGVPASGWNKTTSGLPIGILPDGIGTFSFFTTGIFNPNGGRDVITPETPDDAILATRVPREELLPRFHNFEIEKLLQVEENVPFHLTPIANDGTGLGRASLPGILESNQMDYSRSEPSEAITLGQFKKVRSIVKFSCPENEKPRLVMKFKNLLPNRLYNMFEWFQTGNPVGYFDILPRYVGGLPDSFSSDKFGNGEYRTYINRCPALNADVPKDEYSGIGWVIVMRQNHETHATTIIAPAHPRDARLPGEIATAHVVFPLRAKPYTGN